MVIQFEVEKNVSMRGVSRGGRRLWAIVDGKKAGNITYKETNWNAGHIGMIRVRDQFQRQGVGMALMERFHQMYQFVAVTPWTEDGTALWDAYRAKHPEAKEPMQGFVSSKTAAAKLVGRCSICGERIQRNGEGAKWKHQRPNPDGSPRDHPPKTAALDNEARISVSEHAMENFGYLGETWYVESGHKDDPHYQAMMEPLRDYVAAVCGYPVRVHAASPYIMQYEMQGSQAMVTPTGTMFVKPGIVTELTVLHECAHILNRSTHGQGHDDQFIEIAAELYQYISPAASSQFLSLALPPH